MATNESPISSIEQQRQADIQSYRASLGDLPDTYSGWVRHDRPESIFTYWRAASSHISAEYEALVASPQSSGEAWLSTINLDQFGHTVSTTTHTSRSEEQADWLWDAATNEMDSFPGSGEFEQPPAMPETVGEWVTTRVHDGTNRETVFSYDWGFAEIHVEQLGIEAHYAHTQRPHRVWYADIEMSPDESHLVVDGIPRRSAYEIAVNTMEKYTPEMNTELQSVKGIGPAKQEQLCLLGIPTVDALRDFIAAGDNAGANHHHRTAVEKVLTTTVRDQF